ncbi:hypothetical protein DFH27DRAFT_521322 [Peziza echinospora]|nr:hypothetical protein DFH27DRAFT_521322 [Peziza echinospora]
MDPLSLMGPSALVSCLCSFRVGPGKRLRISFGRFTVAFSCCNGETVNGKRPKFVPYVFGDPGLSGGSLGPVEGGQDKGSGIARTALPPDSDRDWTCRALGAHRQRKTGRQ